MSGTVQEGPSFRAKGVGAAALPWIIYSFVLAFLALSERLATPEGVGADRLIDVALNLFAFAGMLAAGLWSTTAAKQGYRSPSIVLFSILAGGFLGPLFATIIVTTIAHDVDGGMWMMCGGPIVGLLWVTFGLGILASNRKTRRESID